MKLKSVIGSLLAAATLGVFSGTAAAVTLATVGSYDTLIAQDTLDNSGGAEQAFVESILGPGVTYTQLTNSGGDQWEAVTDGVAGDFAFNLGSEPTHFLVKIGGGGGAGGDDTHFLYENNASLLWAFLNLSDFGAGVDLENILIISHVGVTGGGTVSEPGILGLFGVGLVLLGFMRRRAIA